MEEPLPSDSPYFFDRLKTVSCQTGGRPFIFIHKTLLYSGSF